MNDILKHPDQLSTEFSDIQKQIENVKKEIEKGKNNVEDKIKNIQERIHQYAKHTIEQKNVNLLKQQLTTLKKGVDTLSRGIEKWTKKELGDLEKGIIKKGNNKSSNKEYSTTTRPKDVTKNIQISAEKVVKIAKGEDKNPIAKRMQKGINRLLK